MLIIKKKDIIQHVDLNKDLIPIIEEAFISLSKGNTVMPPIMRIDIEKFHGDPERIFVSGHSAGGYLALMSVMDKDLLVKYDLDANDVAGLVPFSGHTITHFTIRQEMGIPGEQPLIDRWAPIYHVRKDTPPILLITGDREKEMLGRYEENAYFYRMMKVNGQNDIDIYEMDGYGHNMTLPAFPLLLNFVSEHSSN